MKVRKAYNKMAKGKAIACDLGQNVVFAMFCDERCLFTLIRGMGVIWSVQDNRWLCASELLSSMGWPVTPGSQRAALTTTHFSESHEGAASRTHRSQRMQVGNGMHMHAIGAVLLITILKLRIGMADDDASLIESEKKGRKQVDASGALINNESEKKGRKRVDVSETTNVSASSLRTSSTLLSPLEMVRSIRRKVHNETGL